MTAASGPLLPATSAPNPSPIPTARAARELGCAAAACHGAPPRDDAPAWSHAATHWAAHDPHRGAFATLYTQRSLEIYRNLHPDQRDMSAVADQDYESFLRQRCLGCHSTPHSDSEPRFSDDLRDHLEGVTCAACHGQAANWHARHYRTEWPNVTDPRRDLVVEATGFVDLTRLEQRARVCAGCHVGSADSGRSSEFVDHELIAAGHPRLRFELDAYLANLPAHWDRQRDADQHAQRTGGKLHLDAWRLGRAETMRRLATRWPDASVAKPNAAVDFSAYRCVDCHHRIASITPTDDAERASRYRASSPFPMRRALPLDESFLATSREPAQLATHALQTQKLLEQMLRVENRSVDGAAQQRWEECVDLLLAAEALVAEAPESASASSNLPWDDLRRATRAMRAGLTTTSIVSERDAAASTQRLTIYDTPTYFDEASLEEPLKLLLTALTSMTPELAQEPSR